MSRSHWTKRASGALILASALGVASGPLAGQGLDEAKAMVAAHVDANRDAYAATALEIWNLAEVGYMEHESSGLLQSRLAGAGFDVEAGVADIPTAFVASYGSGSPVIAILAEFDALPGITQTASPERSARDDLVAGHACGHHLFGTGSTAAAIAVREWLDESGHEGTIRLYGTPAEEGGAGKVYLVREGLFDDVDAVLHWHAGDQNTASPTSSLANKSAKFRFHGVSAHAAGAPERGRSALDAVEAMNHMVNLMREHVPQETRIHYVITAGGSAPNVIPDFAEVYYYVRNPQSENVVEIFERVVRAAEGAAMGTGTEMEYEVIHGIHALLPNVALGRVVYDNLVEVGGVEYDAEERRFAESLQASFLPGTAQPLESAARIRPFEPQFEARRGGGSTDVADVSRVVPTAGLRTATWVPGTPGHSWQAIASGGTSIGTKGMINAAKALAMSAVELMSRPDVIAEAKREREEYLGPDWVYRPLLGDRPPPLDYRASVVRP